MSSETSDHYAGDIHDLELRRAANAGPSGMPGLLRNPRLLFIAMVGALGGLNYGYEQGAYGQCLVMPSFKSVPAFDRIVNDSAYKGWTVAVLALGGWFGSLVNGYFCERFSRRWSMFGSGWICLLGAGLTAGAMNPDYIFAGRFFIGVAVGSLSTAVPTYGSEIAPAEVRGAFVGTWQLSVTLGIMISFFAGFGTNHISDTSSISWRLPLAFQAIFAIGLIVGTMFIPYSPRWLLSKGRDEEALKVLALVRRTTIDDEQVRLEYLEIKADALFEKEVAAQRFPKFVNKPFAMQFAQIGSLFTSWPMFKRTALTCLMMFFQQMSGIDAIVFYAPIIFESLDIGDTKVALLASGVVGICMFVATFPSLFFVDSIGRRPLAIIGGLGMSLCLVIVGALTGKYQDSWHEHMGAGWASAAFIWFYIFNFGYSWGPVSWIVISELMPMSVRSAGTALGASTNWMTNFAVSLMVPPMLEKITWGTYIFFLAFMLMGVAYIYFLLPETRNVSLEAIDELFKSQDATRDAALRNRIARDLYAEFKGDLRSHNSREKVGSSEMVESQMV